MEKLLTVFENGKFGYRIPSVVTTNSGTVVACCDQRHYGSSDNPNRIDKIIKRSFDNGKTWDDVKVVVPEIGETKSNSSASIDPALLYDKNTNTIVMLYSFTPVGISILTCRRTTGYEGENLMLLGKGKKKFVLDVVTGKILDKKGVDTGFTVDKDGWIFDKDKKNVGNIKINNDYFMMVKTAYLCITMSKDDGETWSEPVCINTQVKKPSWGFIGSGPGIGIVLENGKHKGRYVFPIYIGKMQTPPALSCLALYSDDCGKTWQVGDLIKKMSEKFTLSWLNTGLWTTESQYIELDDGKIMAFVRNHNSQRLIANSYSDDGGATWTGFDYNPYLTHPICQISALRVNIKGQNYVLACCAEDKRARRLGVVKVSLDDGKTFPYRKVLTDGEFVYSSMTKMANDEIGIMYEPETAHTKIVFTSFKIEDLLVKE